MSAAHVSGIIDLLVAAGFERYDPDGNTPNAPLVYDTEVRKSPRFPYVVIATPSLNRVADSLCDTPLDFHDYIRVTGSGTGPEQARLVQDRAYGALDRKSPVVAGYVTDIRRTATGPLAVDREVTLTGTGHPVYSTDTYLYRATPA